ncbi:MAG: PUA domain-containing protein [Asgard group archaeon]|nr:PUA domain-containing protein [Asgard group archaeon]
MVEKHSKKIKKQWDIRKLRRIADYQLGNNIGAILIPDKCKIIYSKNTKRIREVHYQGKRLASLRPTDGLFSLGLAGAERILQQTKKPTRRIIIQSDVSKFIMEGKSVFAKHVVETDPTIRPEEEVIVVSEEDKLLAVGRAQLSAENILAFSRGMAVKTRHGVL